MTSLRGAAPYPNSSSHRWRNSPVPAFEKARAAHGYVVTYSPRSSFADEALPRPLRVLARFAQAPAHVASPTGSGRSDGVAQADVTPVAPKRSSPSANDQNCATTRPRVGSPLAATSQRSTTSRTRPKWCSRARDCSRTPTPVRSIVTN